MLLCRYKEGLPDRDQGSTSTRQSYSMATLAESVITSISRLEGLAFTHAYLSSETMHGHLLAVSYNMDGADLACRYRVYYLSPVESPSSPLLPHVLYIIILLLCIDCDIGPAVILSPGVWFVFLNPSTIALYRAGLRSELPLRVVVFNQTLAPPCIQI